MTVLRGINVDPTNPAGAPDPTGLKALNFNAVRLVCQPPAGGAVEQYAKRCKDAGVYVLAVVANESQGYLIANADLFQLGNEPDGQPPSSWVMTPDEYVQLWAMYRGTYPNLPFIAAGLTSGDPNWWATVAPRLDGCKGVAVHPYGKGLAEAKQLLAGYRAVSPSLPVFVTEWNRPASEIAAYDWWLRQNTAGAFYFCWSDAMVDGFGLVKPELAVFKPFSVTTNPTPVPPPIPAPILHQWQSDNFWAGRPYGPPIAIVLHTEAGSEGATEAWFTNNASQVSAHFGVGLNGQNDQFVQLGDSSWANGIREPGNNWDAHGLPNVNPNYLTCSLETEDLGNNNQPVTDAQYAAVRSDCHLVMQTYPSIRWLLKHSDISPQSRAHCPGDRWVGSGRFAQLAADLGLAMF